jgi:Zn-dependent M16 (insulinase) family peptidase
VCSEIFTVGLKVEQADYEKAIAWIRDIISGCIFDKDR